MGTIRCWLLALGWRRKCPGATKGERRDGMPFGRNAEAGRPVLVAAESAERLPANKAVIAWKDTREARRGRGRAVAFSLGGTSPS